MRLHDRADAGKRLAKALAVYRATNAVVLALPRGGVVVGAVIASTLGLPLDIIAVRKIGHPNNEEYAIGAVNAEGTLLWDEAARGVDEVWLQEEAARQQREAQRRAILYRGARAPLDLAGKIAIIVDDGIATGLTMRLAIASVKAQNPARVVVAVPVAPSDSVHAISNEVDETIVLAPADEFLGAVGAHYDRFEQVDDDEVVRLMDAASPIAYSERHEKGK